MICKIANLPTAQRGCGRNPHECRATECSHVGQVVVNELTKELVSLLKKEGSAS